MPHDEATTQLQDRPTDPNLLIHTIDLSSATLGFTKPLEVRPGRTNLDVTINATTWGVAVVEPQISLTLGDDDQFFRTLPNSFTLNSSNTIRLGIPVPSGAYVRLKTTTAATGASAAAKVTMRTR